MNTLTDKIDTLNFSQAIVSIPINQADWIIPIAVDIFDTLRSQNEKNGVKNKRATKKS